MDKKSKLQSFQLFSGFALKLNRHICFKSVLNFFVAIKNQIGPEWRLKKIFWLVLNKCINWSF